MEVLVTIQNLQEELEKLYNFMEVLFNLMKLDKKDKDYEYYFAKLPKEYQEGKKYNYLVFKKSH